MCGVSAALQYTLRNTMQEEILYKWKAKYNKEIVHRDGILDEKLWSKSKIKTLIILKEDYNCRKIFNKNLAKAFRFWAFQKATKPTLRRLYLVSLGIPHLSKPIPHTSREWRLAEKYFMGSALINIKNKGAINLQLRKH